MQAKYLHTNIVAVDWRKLADFYTRVFGCVYVPPERDYSGVALDAATGLVDAHLRGVHLRLPGWGAGCGTQMEIMLFPISGLWIKSKEVKWCLEKQRW